jgi:uncharacterized protein
VLWADLAGLAVRAPGAVALPLGLNALSDVAEIVVPTTWRPGAKPSPSKECTIRLDPRSPFVLDTHELGRRPGEMRKVQRTSPAPADLGTDVIGVPPGSDLTLDLRLESVLEGVLVSGTVRGLAVGECVRCLEAVELDVEADIQELFAYPGRAHEEDEDEIREIEDDLINLEPAIRDSIVPALPFQPVCQEDCPGLCSECGARLADDPDHRHEVVDPRWAALTSLNDTHDEKES